MIKLDAPETNAQFQKPDYHKLSVIIYGTHEFNCSIVSARNLSLRSWKINDGIRGRSAVFGPLVPIGRLFCALQVWYCYVKTYSQNDLFPSRPDNESLTSSYPAEGAEII